MPDRSDQLRDKLFEEYEDCLFRLVIFEAAKREGRLLWEEKESLKGAENLPAEAEVRKFEKRVSVLLKKRAFAGRKHAFHKTAGHAAAAALIVMLTFSLAVGSVSAFRVRVLNFLISVEEKYTSFQLREEENAAGGKLTIDRPGEYVPSYVPEGFEIKDFAETESIKRIHYENADGRVLLYSEYSSSCNVAVDSENASRIETIEINGNAGTLIVKSPMASVVWEMEGRLFLVHGELEADEVLQFARGVKLVE
jgi:hypothetical protein